MDTAKPGLLQLIRQTLTTAPNDACCGSAAPPDASCCGTRAAEPKAPSGCGCSSPTPQPASTEN